MDGLIEREVPEYTIENKCGNQQTNNQASKHDTRERCRNWGVIGDSRFHDLGIRLGNSHLQCVFLTFVEQIEIKLLLDLLLAGHLGDGFLVRGVGGHAALCLTLHALCLSLAGAQGAHVVVKTGK